MQLPDQLSHPSPKDGGSFSLTCLRKPALLALGWICLGVAQAACNNPTNWLESPKDGVKVLIGYEQDLGGHFASQPANGLDTPAFAPPLPQDIQANDAQGTLPKDEDKGVVSYYEPDGKDGWRICRKEDWFRRSESTRPASIARTEKNQSRNVSLAPVLRSHVMGAARVYLYDSKGRIQETFAAAVYEPEKSERVTTDERQCFRFNDQNLLQLYVSATATNACPSGDPDSRDTWRRFRYGAFKNDRGQTENGSLWIQWHQGNGDGRWSESIVFRNSPKPGPERHGGNASVDSSKGVTQILGGFNIGLRDRSDGPALKYTDGSSKPIEYYFTKPPVPVSMLDDIEQLYRHDRRRETQVLSGIKLIEFYPAGAHQPLDRFYMAAGRTLRQEQYDDSGKLKRVINLGFVGLNKKDGGFYDEDLRGKVGLKLKGNKLLYRVWEYDAAGKAGLIAIGWDTKFGSAAREEPLDLAQLAFGSPDGTVGWKREDEFFKTFDFDPIASRAYPDPVAK